MEEDDTYKCGEDDDEVRKKYRETTDVVMYLNVLRVFGFPLVLKNKVMFIFNNVIWYFSGDKT